MPERKLTREHYQEVLRLHNEGHSQAEIARHMGLAQGHVSGILRGHTGRWATGLPYIPVEPTRRCNGPPIPNHLPTTDLGVLYPAAAQLLRAIADYLDPRAQETHS